MISTILLLALLGVATATDVKQQKIYNWTTYSGILAAIALNTVASATVAGGSAGSLPTAFWGAIGLPASVLGLVICGLVMLVCYVLLILYFRSRGGYKPVELETEGS